MAEEIDAVKAIRATLNTELLKLNDDLTKADTNFDFTLDRINEIARTLKKLPKEEKPKEKKSGKFADEPEDERSYSERKADNLRKD